MAMSEPSNARNILIFQYLIFLKVDLYPRLYPRFAFDTRLLLPWLHRPFWQ